MGESGQSEDKNGDRDATSVEDIHSVASAPVPRPIKLAVGSGGQATSFLPAHGTRRYLAGFMARDHLAPLIQRPLTKMSAEQQAALWLKHAAAAEAIKHLAHVDLAVPNLVPLDGAEAAWVREVEQTELFRRHFAGPYTFANIPIDRLVVFQPMLKPMHREMPLDSEGVMHVCLPKEFPLDAETQTIPSPNGFRFLFYSDDPTPEFNVEASKPGVVQLTLKARPNWVQVAIANDRLVLRNGYHRVAALAARGCETVPAVVVSMPSLMEAIPVNAEFFGAQYLSSLSRPPLITDFFNPDISIDVQQAEVRQVVEARLDLFPFQLPR